MSIELAELHRYLTAELRKIEYWRESPNLKSKAEIQSGFEPKKFTPTEKPPITPNSQSTSRILWERLYGEYQRREPYNFALNITCAVCSLFVLFITVVLVSQIHSLIVGVILGVLAATVVSAAGIGISRHARHKDITEKVANVFDARFSEHWNDLLEKYAGQITEYHDVQRQKQARWDKSEQQRIAAFDAEIRDPGRTKSRIASLFDRHRYLTLGTPVVLSVHHLALDLRIPTLKDVIEHKTKTLSEKTGKVISKSKSRDEKKSQYERFAAGSCLSAIVQVFNVAPLCKNLSIAIYSESDWKRAYHICGQIDRVDLPSFSWDSVDPVMLLTNAEFRIEGSSTRKLTSKPEWLERLEQVRINIP